MTEQRFELAQEITDFIIDHKGIDTQCIDVRGECSWADYFVIATVSSLGHLKGLVKELWGFLADRPVEINNRHKQVAGDGWELVDCGDIVIHLMSSELREFYALEKLWKKPQGVVSQTLARSES